MVDAGGNISAAATATGVHRNTIQRVLKAAGYDSRKLMRLGAQQIVEGWRSAAAAAKPVASVGADGADWRVA